MTEHRATSKQWSGIERFVRYGAYDSCLIELQNRVEALEAAQRVITSPSSNRTHLGLTQDAPESSDSLVGRVADGIAETFAPYVTADKPARAAIHDIADWLDQQDLHIAATRLRMEVG